MSLNTALIPLNMRARFPMPAGTDMDDAAAFSGFIETSPPSGLLGLMRLAHLDRPFVGGPLSARLTVSRPMALELLWSWWSGSSLSRAPSWS